MQKNLYEIAVKTKKIKFSLNSMSSTPPPPKKKQLNKPRERQKNFESHVIQKNLNKFHKKKAKNPSIFQF